MLLTDNTLPEEVTLTGSGISAREFPINFVLGVTHGDECDDDTLPTAGLDFCYERSKLNSKGKVSRCLHTTDCDENALLAVMVP